ncbi:IclR family transcriptional regulator [Nesterenkonia sp. NBAIMH1]|uniref:IclR family transcriptional regulator n=1 Tax=Nesterenkonia sp. NBAIMH1 TaxID=2600320 RepID=UPI001FEE6AFD|nr:IclR family transcriptional regulator [Nesterenkonia sp. NBAIMH1]
MANSRSGDALLDRVMRILGALERDPVLSPGELAEAAELPRTTAYRLITDLVERGMLARTAVGDIELGQRLWEIAQHTVLSRTLRHAALPFMQDVNYVVQQTTQLAVLDGADVLIVERLSRRGAVSNPAEVASRMPVHLTSMGHALLAFAAPGQMDRVMSVHGERIRRERPEFLRELGEARSRGHVRLGGLINTDTAGASVPILDARGHAIAALTIVVPLAWDRLPQALMAMQTASRGISRALAAGGRPPTHRGRPVE